MNVQRFLHAIDGISTWVGKAAAWLIIALMTVVCVEVFKRYILNAPTAWIFDLDNMLYGTLFMLCGAYTLAQNAHVRGALRAHLRACQRDGGGPASLSVQDDYSDRGGAGDAAGRRRDRALRGLPESRGMAEPTARRRGNRRR